MRSYGTFLTTLLYAEWIFFSTSHGKGPCDGIGATIKCTAYRHVMRHPGPEHSLTSSLEFYNFSKEKFEYIPNQSRSNIATTKLSQPKVFVFYADETDIRKIYDTILAKRWLQRPSAGPIIGIRGFHHFISLKNNIMKCKTTSISTYFQQFQMITATSTSNQTILKFVKKVTDIK
ncbi:unnamed protein product, partial [Didymodactylos carnosus]